MPTEPTDIDQIYQVLKKANEISSGKAAAAESKAQTNTTTTSDANAMTGASNPQLEIPVVNVPDYPDRTPRRGPPKSQGPNYQQQKQGLSAPTTTDMSSSGPH